MFRSILSTFANCFKIPELKSRVVFTLLMLAVCRLIALTTVPGVDGHRLAEYFEKIAQKAGAGGGLLGLYSMFTGGAMEHCGIGALGIMPYISATIIIQLIGAVIPTLSKLMREEGGRAKIIQYGRYLTVLLCLGQGFVMSLAWENPSRMPGFNDFAGQLVRDPGWMFRLETTLILTTGTLLLMWLGEQITERGIGNGVSLVITIGILARLPAAAKSLYRMFFLEETHKYTVFSGLMMAFFLVGVVAAVIAMTQAQRKIPVQYAQRTIGRKTYAGQSSFMPLRVNYAGVMPIIFAQAIMMFPVMIFGQLYSATNIELFNELARLLNEDQFLHMFLVGALIIFFSYFWVATQFNELQIADDLKKYGGYIPGVRPGTATSDFLHRCMSRITLAGAIFLAIIAIIPYWLSRQMSIDYVLAQFFGGTSLLISVGVVLDTVRQMESHLLMRHYDGFLSGGSGRKGPRLRGRF